MSSVPGVTHRALGKGAPQGVLRRRLPLPPTIAVSFSVAAPAPEVPVPAAGPEPWPVLRRVPAQREPDWERHRGSALPGESPCLPHATSHLERVAGRAPPCPRARVPVSKPVNVGDHQAIAATCPSATHRPPRPLLPLGWPGQASPGSPLPVPCQQTPQQGQGLAVSISAAATPVGRLCGAGNRSGPLGLGSVPLH